MIMAFKFFYVCNYYANITATAKDLCHEWLCNGAGLSYTVLNVAALWQYYTPDLKINFGGQILEEIHPPFVS